MIRFLRWIAIVPAALAGWYLALFLGIFLLGIAEKMCPPEHVISEICTAWWFRYLESAIIYLGVAIVAFFVVIFPAFVAPSHRSLVARSVFFIGTLVAGYMAWSLFAWGEFIAAVAAGLFAVLLSRRCQGNSEMADKL